MLHIIKKLSVPRVILRYIMMNNLDLADIKTIILNIKEMNVLDNFSKTILSNAKHGLVWNCKKGNLSTVQYLVELGNSHRLSSNSTCRYSDKVELGNSHRLSSNSTCRYSEKVELGNSHRLSSNSTCRYADKVSVGADIHTDDNYA